ncbi:nuclease [Allopusillimonas soli]|uniref:DNA 3'-5' helicase n=1 Tax=Allopusillimonas soli TaxID=659016 RepID=A0A853FFW4_9BURK|nr:UvrD-helicase domain-containing protein [Allopusillimonas soli]NYT38562.1 UvrD-helicase domain-containing protein [Allopusillimonas soli]TEA71723.1 nuclease [Allopusillimonas soli]
MTHKQPSDSALRLAALDPQHSFLVQAPAGSGKTELLTDRILALLPTVGKPEEIVAITFTRKAASEMHKRLLDKLRLGLNEDPPDDPYRLGSWKLARAAMARDKEMGWDLLQYPARLGLRTIDAFCAHLVRAMPWMSALGGMPAFTDNAQAHYEAAAQATLAMADNEPCVAALVEHLDVDLRAARDLLAQMLASRDQWLPLLSEGGEMDVLRHNLATSIETDLARLRAGMPDGWAQALAPALRHAAEVIAGKTGQDAGPLGRWDGTPFPAEAASLDAWQALADALLTKQGLPRRRVTAREGFEPKSPYKQGFQAWLNAVSEADAWVRTLHEIRVAPREGYSDSQEAVLGSLIQVLWLAAAQLQLRFAETGQVDFIEVSQRALNALGAADAPTELLLALDRSIRHILVDEFQDTSQTQIALLERLTAGWEPDDGRTLFLVGDPMQSIYRFRKADVGGFLRVKEHGIGHIPVTALELSENFRSQGRIVAWVNDTCQPIFPAENHPGLGAIVYTPSVPFRDPESGPPMTFHPIWTHDERDAQDTSRQTEDLVVRLARQALEDNPDSDHPVAILVRARGHLAGIVHRLAQAGIPCRAVDLVPLKDRQAVIDLTQLARALSHPADRLAWLSVLRSPLCGLTLASLHSVCGDYPDAAVPDLLRAWMEGKAPPALALPTGSTIGDGMPMASEEPVTSDWGHLEASEARRLRMAAGVLLDDANDAGTVPFAAWLASIWRRLGGFDIYGGPGDVADTERLFRLIEQLSPYGNLDPGELEQRVEQLFAAPEGSGRAVEVMTIHKAKGLEFETVILPGLHKMPRGDSQPLLMLEHHEGALLMGPIKHRAARETDPVSAYLMTREKKRAAYEADRLLYVALTRARRSLHLIGEVGLDGEASVKTPVPGSLLGRLWEHLGSPALPPADLRAPDAAREASGRRWLARRRLDSLPQPDAPVAEILNDKGEEAGIKPLVETRGVAWNWRDDAGEEAVIGTVAHAWLERIGREGLSAWSPGRVHDCAPVFRRQLSRAGLPQPALDHAVEAIRDTLCATLSSARGQWLLQVAQAYREWSLLDISGRVSIIDLAISQENDWLVVDYKTGRPQDGESVEHYADRMRERYRAQIERYCAHVTALDGRPARGALYFPRADIWVDYPMR